MEAVAKAWFDRGAARVAKNDGAGIRDLEHALQPAGPTADAVRKILDEARKRGLR